MEYSQENPTPIKIKISVTSSPAEVDAAINRKIQEYKSHVQLPGFRTGKAPANLISKKFGPQILEEAREELLDDEIREIVAKEGIKPLANLELSAPKEFERGKPAEWSFTYEVLPEFDLPEYTGLKAEHAKAFVSEEDVARALNGLKTLSSRKIPVTDNSLPKDGQIVNADIDIISDGKPVAELSLPHFDMEIGKGMLLPEIDSIARGLPVGNITEKEIAFPENFPNSKLAGQTHLVRMKINSLSKMDSSAWDSRWAGKDGEKNLGELKELIRSSQSADMENRNKAITETALLEQLLKQVDFPVPEALADFEYRRILSELNSQLQSRGLSLGAMGEKLGEILENAKKDAEKAAARETLLLAIAAKEGLKVDDQELLDAIEEYSNANGEEFNATLRSMRESGTINFLRNKLLSDKAMDLIYSKAEIIEVSPETKASQPEETE